MPKTYMEYEAGQIVRHRTSGQLYRIIRYGYMGSPQKYGRPRKPETETVSVHEVDKYTRYETAGGLIPLHRFNQIMQGPIILPPVKIIPANPKRRFRL